MQTMNAQINIKTGNRNLMPNRSCMSSKSSNTGALPSARSSKKRARFEDDKEEAKYGVYLKHVRMLN